MIGAALGDAIGQVSGALGTGIDCVAELTSPACILGGFGVLTGAYGTSLVKTARHASQYATIFGKLARIAGIHTSMLSGIIAWGDWWKRRNFGQG